MRFQSLTRAGVLGLAAAAAICVAPSAAQAGTASYSGGTLVYQDATGAETNNVVVRPQFGKIIISDTAGVRSPDPRCRIFNGDLECESPSFIQVVTGGGFDRVEYRAPHAGLVSAGPQNDTVVAGRRESAGMAIQPVTYRGDDGYDVVDYSRASAGVAVDMADNVAADGRPGDRESVSADFEFLYGSQFRDTLFGTPGPDGISGQGDRDVIAGGFGDDVFYSTAADGADDYHGGPDVDTIEYFGRTAPLTVKLDNIATDGEAGEFDNVRPNVENIGGGNGDDTFESFSVFSRLEGRDGADTLNGGDGPDTIIGGAGSDAMTGGQGIDVIDARDGFPDFADCGTERDSLTRDVSEGITRNCETVQVGVLKLADRSVTAAADGTAKVRLDWRHPEGWRQLRSVQLRLLDNGTPVGAVTVRDGRRVEADGAVRLDRGATRVVAAGKAVSAVLALDVDEIAAGRTLTLEVEATDRAGRRQLERGAGTLRVTR